MSETPTPGGRLTINLGALAANWRAVAAKVAGETSAVVKANAYGIGIEAAGPALARAGCRTFFVALPSEALRLRRAVPDAIIYVLAGLMPGSLPMLTANNLRPVLGSMPEIADWAAAGAPIGSAVHVDTGMNRLGITPAEAVALDVASIRPSLVMSHFVVSEEPGDPLNRRQRDAFAEVRAAMPGIPASLANSAGIYLGPEFHFDLVRPGIVLYGASPGPKVAGPMNIVVTAGARVLIVRDAQPGETVGYGATRRLDRPTKIAVLGVGYADGYHRIAKGGYVMIRGQNAPLLGRVSMDLTAVDVTDIPGVTRDDWAELFGPNLPVDEVAAWSGTVGYELLTGLGHRYERRYQD
ncbi:MAG TPA: alanine racemase [Bauldia sp.]|nr:alanine racemase [Bauldia sp.]